MTTRSWGQAFLNSFGQGLNSFFQSPEPPQITDVNEYLKKLEDESIITEENRRDIEAHLNTFAQYFQNNISEETFKEIFLSYLKRFFDKKFWKSTPFNEVTNQVRLEYYMTHIKQFLDLKNNTSNKLNLNVGSLNLNICKTNTNAELDDLEEYFSLFHQKKFYDDFQNISDEMNKIKCIVGDDISQINLYRKLIYQMFYLSHLYMLNLKPRRIPDVKAGLDTLESHFWDFQEEILNFNTFLFICISSNSNEFVPDVDPRFKITNIADETSRNKENKTFADKFSKQIRKATDNINTIIRTSVDLEPTLPPQPPPSGLYTIKNLEGYGDKKTMLLPSIEGGKKKNIRKWQRMLYHKGTRTWGFDPDNGDVEAFVEEYNDMLISRLLGTRRPFVKRIYNDFQNDINNLKDSYVEVASYNIVEQEDNDITMQRYLNLAIHNEKALLYLDLCQWAYMNPPTENAEQQQEGENDSDEDDEIVIGEVNNEGGNGGEQEESDEDDNDEDDNDEEKEEEGGNGGDGDLSLFV